jgi:tetratricopeptide (TPR) repeat protein
VREPLAVLPQGLCLLALAGATGWACWRRPAAGFAGAAFFAVLAPSSSIIPLVTQTIAEHRMYLPLAAVLALTVVAAGARFGRKVLAPVLVIVVLCAFLTVRRNHDYRSEYSIWSDTVAKAPDNARARVNLAEILLLEGRPAEALPHATAAVQLQPNDAEAQMNLAAALAQTGRPHEALPYAVEAVRLQSDYLRAQSNLGAVLAMLGRLPEAIAHFERALQLSPGPAEAVGLHNNLGHALALTGRPAEAVGQFERVLQLQPDHAGARHALAALRGQP